MTNLRHTDTKARSRNSRRRGKEDENTVARILGGKRHLANSGGPEDVQHDTFALQIKGGSKVVTNALREGMASARAAAANTTKLPACVLVDRRGTRLQRYIVFDLAQFAEFHGYTQEAGDE